MTHYVISITTNYPDQLPQYAKLDEHTFLFDVAAEDFVHAIAQLPQRLPDDAIVKLERTYR